MGLFEEELGPTKETGRRHGHFAGSGIGRSFDDADFQQWSENTFDIPPTFIYEELETQGLKVGVFEIQRGRSYPHVVENDIGGTLYKGQVWYRRGSKNTVALQTQLRGMFEGSEPFKVGKLRDTVLTEIKKHYEEQGRTPVLPLFSEKDSKLSQGYEIAYYPGTRREVWCGASGDIYQHILLLKPRA